MRKHAIEKSNSNAMDVTSCSKKTDMHKIVETEQEYSGAYVWTFDHYFCNTCVKSHNVPVFRGVQENTRGY